MSEARGQTTTQRDRPRILLVVRGFTHPPTIGGRQRNNLLLRALQMVGDVDLVAIDGSALKESDERYMCEHHGLRAVLRMPAHGDLIPWRWFRPLHPTLVQRLAHNFGRRARMYRPQPLVSGVIQQLHAQRGYDLVVGRYLSYATVAGLHRFPRSILDVDDMDTEVYRSRLAEPTVPAWERLVLRRHIRQLRPILRRTLPQFSALWVSNPGDRVFPELERARLLVNLPFQAVLGEPPPTPPPPDCKTAIVVSSWGHRPNTYGLDVFIQRVWPQILESCPDAVLRVIGSQMDPTLRDRLRSVPGIYPIGFVEDLSREYAQCAFAIAPIFSGGGTNIKVLEALWHGRTCLVSGVAHRGYQQTLPAGKCLQVAEDLDALATGAIRLYTQPEYRDRLAAAGRAAVLAHYSFDSFRRAVKETVECVISDSCPGGQAASAMAPECHA